MSLTNKSWKPFYELYCETHLGRTNEQGWINLSCQLPTHEKNDTDDHGAVNVDSGNYRCMKPSCMAAALRKLKKPNTSQILTPVEFLQLTKGWDNWTAETIVNEYRLEHLTRKANSGQYDHDDSGFSKTFSVLSKSVLEDLKAAQAALDPDLDIIYEYCTSRGIKFETLQAAGAGYFANYLGKEYIALPYWAGRQLVGVRLRGWHGTNKRTIKNSSFTLFGSDALLSSSSRTAIVVEGETDTLCLRQALIDHGFGDVPVVGVPGVGFRLEWARHFAHYSRIIAVPQSDRPSQIVLLNNLREAFPRRLEVVQLPWPPHVFGGNDVSDFLRAGEDHAEQLVQLLGLSIDDVEPIPYVSDEERLYSISGQQPEWLVQGLIERGTKTLVVGEPKSYKTWVALNLAWSVLSGDAFMGNRDWKPTSVGSVMLVEEEGSPYRLAERVVKVWGGARTGRFKVIHRQGVKLDDDDSFSTLRQEVLRFRPDLLILDPYASLHLQDENTVQGTMLVQEALNTLLRALPSVAIVTLHHTPKEASGPRGSGALWGASDVLIKIARKGSGLIEFQTRERDLPDEREGGIEFLFNASTGRFTMSGMIKTTQQEMGDEAEDGDLLRIREYLRDADDWVVRATVCQDLGLNLSSTATKSKFDTLCALGLADERGEGRRGSPKEYRTREGVV